MYIYMYIYVHIRYTYVSMIDRNIHVIYVYLFIYDIYSLGDTIVNGIHVNNPDITHAMGAASRRGTSVELKGWQAAKQ